MVITSGGQSHWLWRAVVDRGDVREIPVQKRPDADAARPFLRESMHRWCQPRVVVTDTPRRDRAEIVREDEHSADLKRAEDYVRAILPQPILDGPVRTEWCFAPSATLGGDAFGCQFLSETIYSGFLLDVSGHGIGLAMHAANVANTLRRRPSPGLSRHPRTARAGAALAAQPRHRHAALRQMADRGRVHAARRAALHRLRRHVRNSGP